MTTLLILSGFQTVILILFIGLMFVLLYYKHQKALHFEDLFDTEADNAEKEKAHYEAKITQLTQTHENEKNIWVNNAAEYRKDLERKSSIISDLRDNTNAIELELGKGLVNGLGTLSNITKLILGENNLVLLQELVDSNKEKELEIQKLKEEIKVVNDYNETLISLAPKEIPTVDVPKLEQEINVDWLEKDVVDEAKPVVEEIKPKGELTILTEPKKKYPRRHRTRKPKQ